MLLCFIYGLNITTTIKMLIFCFCLPLHRSLCSHGLAHHNGLIEMILYFPTARLIQEAPFLKFAPYFY